jgi:alpha-tubulin suppressor-like RCC1 family protein
VGEFVSFGHGGVVADPPLYISFVLDARTDFCQVLSSSGSIPVPQLVPGISNATQVATGGSSSVAVNADRRVLVWGDNSSGQLGNGVIGGSSFTPGLVQNLFDVRSVAVGSDHVLALLENGTVFAWGDDCVYR